jgi:uncharacterized protein YjeT (DUF2065 family)
MHLSRAHRIVGLTGLALFIATGIYMRLKFPALYQGRESIRFLFRANHIYLVLSSMVNIAMGLGLTLAPPSTRRKFQLAASAFLLAAPFILFAAFFIDPPSPDSDRNLSRIGVILTVAGTLLHLLARPKKQPPV